MDRSNETYSQESKLLYFSDLVKASPRKILHTLDGMLQNVETPSYTFDFTKKTDILLAIRLLNETLDLLTEIPLVFEKSTSSFRGSKYHHEGSSPDAENMSEGEVHATERIKEVAQRYLLETHILISYLEQKLQTLEEAAKPLETSRKKATLFPQFIPKRFIKGAAAAMIGTLNILSPVQDAEHPQVAQSHLLDSVQQNERSSAKNPEIASLILSIKKSLDIPIEDNTNIHRDPPQVNEETSVSQPLSKERRNIKQTVELETTQVTEYDRKVALAWLNVDPDKGNIPSNFAVNDNTIHILKNANGDWSISWANTELSQKFPIKTDTKLATAIQKHLTAYSTTFDDAAAKRQDSFLIVTFDGLDVVIASKIAETVQRSDSLQPVITKGIQVNTLSSIQEKVQLPLTGANEVEDIIKVTEASQKYFAQFGIETRVGSTIMISYIKTPSGDLLLVRYMTDEGSVFVQGPTITKNATATGTPTPTRDEGAAVLITDKDINFQNAEAKPADALAVKMNALQDNIGDTLKENLTEPGLITTSSDGILTIYSTKEFLVTHPNEVSGKLLFDQATVDRLEVVIIAGWIWQMNGNTQIPLSDIEKNKEKYIALLKKSSTIKVPSHLLSDNSLTNESVSKLLKPGGITIIRLGNNAQFRSRWATTVQMKGDFGRGTVNDGTDNIYMLVHREIPDTLLESDLIFTDVINELKVINKLVNTQSDKITYYLFPQLAALK